MNCGKRWSSERLIKVTICSFKLFITFWNFLKQKPDNETALPAFSTRLTRDDMEHSIKDSTSHLSAPITTTRFG